MDRNFILERQFSGKGVKDEYEDREMPKAETVNGVLTDKCTKNGVTKLPMFS
jgi:hypothetical protein